MQLNLIDSLVNNVSQEHLPRLAVRCRAATRHSLPEAFIFENDQKRSKKSFAA